MLKYLFGRPGSGKTTYIINEIKKHVEMGEKAYLLVPEQQAYISEAMLADLPPSSALCFEVVTFSRLCQIVFGIVGGLTDSHIGSAEKHLIMWQSLREVAPFLKQYKAIKNDASFGSMMLSVINELHASSITPEDCENIAEKCEESALSAKLEDIALIYAVFMKNIGDRLGEGALASEHKLSRLALALSENKIFTDCNIYVDSFTSFTGEEFSVLEEIIRQAKNTTVSFATPHRRSAGPHTESIDHTVRKLTAMAKRHSVESVDIVLEKNIRAVSEIVAIEENLWNFSLRKDTLPQIASSDRGQIEAFVCHNEYEEANAAALNILKAHKDGMKYSDIAVIMRDSESRRGVINAVFDRMNIPYFYSEKTDLSTTPAARLILSALRCITYNFQLQDVLTLLKTGLCGIDLSDADLFEDYCATWDICGSLFTEKIWSMNPDGYTVVKSNRGERILAAANKVRASLIPPLEEMKQKFSLACGNTEKNCRAIYEYLKEIGIDKNLSSLAELELSLGNVKEAGELLRTYDYIVSSLTNISIILADAPTSPEELALAIEIMLRHTDIGSVPAVNDCVTIGSADTLRVENIKMAVLLGLCEGEFPAAFSDGGILNENDKKLLDELGLELSSRESRIISDELFFVYRAMTKPSDKLILCTCTSHIGGGALTPSVAYNRVKYILPYLCEKKFDLARLREASEERNNGVQSEQIINDDGVIIDPLIVKNIFGERLYLSKSSVTSFAECPYKYWCEYVLKLREQGPSEISYASAGTIIHYVLEKLLRKIVLPDGSLPDLSDDEIISYVNDIVLEHISELNCNLTASLSHSFARLRDLALIMAKSVIDEFRTSKFKVIAFEKRISDKVDDALRPVEISVECNGERFTVVFGGTVDRIDCYDNGETRFLRVVDYKTGSHKFDPQKVESGEDIQLPAYLFTAAGEANLHYFGDGSTLVPASAQFLSAEETQGHMMPTRSGFILNDGDLIDALGERDKEDAKGKKKSPSASPLNADEFAKVKEDFVSSVSKIGESIYSGNIPKTPSEDACRFCSLRKTCPSAIKTV